MTIPVLKRNAGEQETVAGIKKTYSMLSQAVMLSENDNGPLSRWAMKDNTIFFQTYLKPYLNVIKDCGTNSVCFGPSITNINGSAYNSAVHYKVVLADGTRMFIETQGEHSHIEVDINGNKPPNTFGTDVFAFTITKKAFTDYAHKVTDPGVYYFGQGIERDAALAECKSTGYTCSALIMMDGGKIKYY